MKSKCQHFEISYGIGPISNTRFIKFTDGEYERLVPVTEARKIAGEILQACDEVEGV